MITNIPSIGFMNALIVLLIVVISVSFHEFTHALIAYMRGDETAYYEGRLSLNPLAHFEQIGFLMMVFTNFGWGKPVPINPNNLYNQKIDSLFVALGGPISNLLLATFSGFLLRGFIGLHMYGSSYGLIVTIFTYMTYINVGLAVFNLLPFPPLDGSNIYKVFLPYEWQYRLSGISYQYMIIIFLLLFIPIINGQSIVSAIIGPIIQTITGFLIP